MLSIRANERGQAATGKAIGRATRAATINIIRQRLIAPAALLALAGLSVALSPAVALAGVERFGHGAWHEARGGEPSPSFSRWNIALEINDSAVRAAQRGGPLSFHATVNDAGFGGLVGLLADERGERRSVRTNFEIRPAPDERRNLRNADLGQAGGPIMLPATSANADRERFEASAAGRILSSLHADRVQVRAASYTPPLPRITPRLGGSTTPRHAGRPPGWWRGVSEWRVVDLEPTPALERLWVRITGADGLLRGLYELDPRREGQRVPASAGDVVTIEVDSSVQLWGMEVELTEKDAAMPEQPVPVDAVFEEVERGVSDRVAWRSYRICGHEGSEVGVGVRAIAQRRTANGAGAGASRGLVSDTSSPFSLLIAQASDWVETAQSAEAGQQVEEVSEAASQEPANTGAAARDSVRTDAGETTPTTPTRLTGAIPSSDSNARPDGSANDTRAVPTAQHQAGGESAPAPRQTPRNNNNETGRPQQRPATGPISQPTGEPQLGGDPEPGSSGRTTRRDPEPEPASDPQPEPEITPPTQRIGGGDEPELVQSVALFIPRGGEDRTSGNSANADRMITVLGLDAVSPEDRTIALAYRRMLINEARKASPNGSQVQNMVENATEQRTDRQGAPDERTPNP